MDNNEFKLVKELVEKNDRAWNIFYEKYYKLVYKAIRTTIVNRNIQCFADEDACDILQNILAYIISNDCGWLKRLSKKDSLKSCLYHLAIHRTLDFIKSAAYQSRLKTTSLSEKSSIKFEEKNIDDYILEIAAAIENEKILSLNPEKILLKNEIIVQVENGLKFLANQNTITYEELIIFKKRCFDRIKSKVLAEKLIKHGIKTTDNKINKIVFKVKEELKKYLQHRGINSSADFL